MSILQILLSILLLPLILSQCSPRLTLDNIETGMITAALDYGDVIMSKTSNEVQYTYLLKRSQNSTSPQATFGTISKNSGLIAFDGGKSNTIAFQIRVSQATSSSLLIRLITPWSLTQWRSLKFSMIVSSRDDFEAGIHNVPNWQPSQIQIAIPFFKTYTNVSSYIARPFLAGGNMVSRASHISWQILQLSISPTSFVVGVASNSEITGLSFGYFVFSPPLAGFTSYGGIASQPQLRGTLYQVIQMSLSTLVNYAFGIVGFSASVSSDFSFSSSIDSNFILTLHGDVKNVTVSFLIFGVGPNTTCSGSGCTGMIPSYNRCVMSCAANQAFYTFSDGSRGCIECPGYAHLTINGNRTDCTCEQGYYILRGVCTQIPANITSVSATNSMSSFSGLSAEALQSQFFGALGGRNTTTTQTVTTTTYSGANNNNNNVGTVNSQASGNLINFSSSGYSTNANNNNANLMSNTGLPIQILPQNQQNTNQGSLSISNNSGQLANFNQVQPLIQPQPQTQSQSQLQTQQNQQTLQNQNQQVQQTQNQNQGQYLLQTQNQNQNLNLNQQQQQQTNINQGTLNIQGAQITIPLQGVTQGNQLILNATIPLNSLIHNSKTVNSNSNSNLQQSNINTNINTNTGINTQSTSAANTNTNSNSASSSNNRCTDPNSYYSSSANTCFCNPGLINMNGRCQSCPAGTQFNGANCINTMTGQIHTASSATTNLVNQNVQSYQPQISQPLLQNQGYSQGNNQQLSQQQYTLQQQQLNQQQLSLSTQPQQLTQVNTNPGLPTSYVPTSYYPTNIVAGSTGANQYNSYIPNTINTNNNNQIINSYIPNSVSYPSNYLFNSANYGNSLNYASTGYSTAGGYSNTGYSSSGLPLSYVPHQIN